MLNPEDYQDALRRYKNKRLNGHERQRYHALLLVTKGYSYRQIADSLFVDEETISQWVRLYEEHGLDGLKNHPRWGGEHGQCRLSESEAAQLSQVLEQEAMLGLEHRIRVPHPRGGDHELPRAVRVGPGVEHPVLNLEA